jgi:hypothetical protein
MSAIPSSAILLETWYGLVVIAGLRTGDPRRPLAPVNYAHWPAFAYRALLSPVSDCGNLSNDRTTLVGWDVRRWLRNDAAAAV